MSLPFWYFKPIPEMALIWKVAATARMFWREFLHILNGELLATLITMHRHVLRAMILEHALHVLHQTNTDQVHNEHQ